MGICVLIISYKLINFYKLNSKIIYIMNNEHAHTLESTFATDPQYWPSENSVKTHRYTMFIQMFEIKFKKIIL